MKKTLLETLEDEVVYKIKQAEMGENYEGRNHYLMGLNSVLRSIKNLRELEDESND
jgi:hypothetical protein